MPTEDDKERERKLTLFADNMGLAGWVAKSMRAVPPAIDDDDIVQQCMLALWRAVDSFDPSRNVKFSTYATPFIRGYVYRLIQMESQTIHLPRWYPEVKRYLSDRDWEFPLTEEQMAEVSTAVKVRKESIELYLGLQIVSLDNQVDYGHSDNHERLGGEPDREMDRIEVLDQVHSMVQRHGGSNKALVEEWLTGEIALDRVNQVDLGEKYGYSQGHVSRILSRFTGKCARELRREM